MSTLSDHVAEFLSRLHARYGSAGTAPPATRDELTALRAVWPRRGTALTPTATRLPACDHLDTALAAGARGIETGLAKGLAPIARQLQWTYGYPETPGTRGLDTAVAFAEIVGPSGFLDSEKIRVGLTLIAPQTHYPLHAHPALELYLVVAGTAAWQLGQEPPKPQPPGSLIFHPSSAPHAMETGGEPLLAIYTWRGDLASPSAYL